MAAAIWVVCASMTGRFHANITAAPVSHMSAWQRRRPVGGPAITTMLPANSGVPGIWVAGIVPDIGATETNSPVIQNL